MTTYPLSEPATVYGVDGDDSVQSGVVGQGTLAECADIVAGLGRHMQKSVTIQMDDLDLNFGPEEVGELLRFLREENSGLSNNEIAEIKNPDA